MHYVYLHIEQLDLLGFPRIFSSHSRYFQRFAQFPRSELLRRIETIDAEERRRGEVL